MRQIVPPISIVQKILGEQKKDEGASYRLTVHYLRAERPEGALLYHTLTGELLLLSREEAAGLEELPGPVPPALEELIPRWFLRPAGADDMGLADQTRQIAERFKRKKTALTRYSILTTTACNARCFYCYEAGWETRTMTEQTARDTAAYIGAHSGGKPVRINWLGGEPLVNTRAIDVITDSLRRQSVAFRSVITSNGYLFDEALIQRARVDWNLELAQLTLDGTEEVYNQRKAYVHAEGSPYQRVMRNIGLLLDEGIRVKVRLNMDNDNERDLYALVDELADRFSERAGFDIFPVLLWEETGMAPPSYTEKERYALAQKRMSLMAYAEEKDIVTMPPLSRRFAANSCSADSDNFTLVTPEGQLGRCVVCKTDVIWGSIYSDEIDEEVFLRWKERKPPEADCKVCAVYPQCVRLKKCPMWVEHCSPMERTCREDLLRRAILGAYKNWKAAGRV